MKVLVTGGAGFIGSNFVHYWSNHHPKDDIVVLDKLTYAGNLANLEGMEKLPTYKFIKGDVANQKDVEEAMKGIDIVVHFAAETHVDNSLKDPFVFQKTNVQGTLTMLEQAKINKIKRFHHVSTDEVFGELPLNGGKFNENTPYNPRNPYSASKAASDHLVRSYYYSHKVPITISNCSNNYGPRQHPEKLLPKAITNLIQNKPIPIYGKGENVRDWLYVEDHCRAIESILTKGKVGETYCIGGLTEDVSNIQIARKISSFMGVPEKSALTFVQDRPGHDLRYAIDWTKINKELGWKPLHPIDQRLKDTIKWYKENESWWISLKK